MFIPMGTVVTLCMIITLVFSHRISGLDLNRITPPLILRIIGCVTGAAGLWNVLWYGLRHPTQFWGLMALGSGLLMTLLSALLILPAERQPAFLRRLRPFALAGLLGFTLTYVVGIYRL